MRVAIPVSEYQGLDSQVHGHFGSAACFAVADTATMQVVAIANGDAVHAHGACSPLRALAGAQPDAVVVGGIGRGAWTGLRQAGIAVYLASSGTVAEVLTELAAGQLQELTEGPTCAGHGGSGPCHSV